MMKRIFLFILPLLGLLSCEPIDKDERLIYVPKPGLEIDTTATERAPKAVLIEDFTGQRCPNCPEATELIEQLQEQAGAARIVAVGIHCDPMGFAGSTAAIGLMNDESREYGRYWGVNSQPIGLIDRTGGLKDRNDWATAVADALSQPSVAGIEVKPVYDTEAKTVAVNVEVAAYEVVSGNLQLWLVEDGIVAMQTMPDGNVNRTYVHNHIFRTALNGAWGTGVNVAAGDTLRSTYTYNIPSAYVPSNCSVVAFVYNATGVQQVTRAKLTTEE